MQADLVKYSMANLKFAIRTLFKKSPFVTAIAIVSLALGIGANAAIFSIFNQILLRALPVPDPDRLVNLGAPGPKPGSTSCNQAGSCDAVFSYPMFRDLEREQTVFSGLAAHRPFNVSLAYRGQSMTGSGMLVSGSYFPVLGVQPALGRLLGPADDRATGESAVAVLSHTYWTSRFAEDPNVLNFLLTINGQQFTIVGVAPRGFNGTTFGAFAHVFVPVTMRPKVEPNRSGFDSRRSYWLCIRPAEARCLDRSRADTDQRTAPRDPQRRGSAAAAGDERRDPRAFQGQTGNGRRGSRGQSSAHTDAKAPLLILLGVTTLVLLIACANIANLLLARSAARAGRWPCACRSAPVAHS
jgi:hypothetical protein